MNFVLSCVEPVECLLIFKLKATALFLDTLLHWDCI